MNCGIVIESSTSHCFRRPVAARERCLREISLAAAARSLLESRRTFADVSSSLIVAKSTRISKVCKNLFSNLRVRT